MTALQSSPAPAPQPRVPAAQGGEAGADGEALLRDLVQTHSARLQRFIIKHIGNSTDAEDLAQQAFVEAAKSYQTFRGESQPSTWLYGIALNLVRNHLSRAPEFRYDFVSDSALDEHHTGIAAPADLAEQKQSIQLLQEALHELPENMRDILLLVGLEGVSYEDAAVMLTVPIGTVRSRLSRARTALREKLAQKGLELDF